MIKHSIKRIKNSKHTSFFAFLPINLYNPNENITHSEYGSLYTE